MKKTVILLKPGAGAIIAFFVLAIVFASIAGVVFIAINQSPGKIPRAANSYAAGNLNMSTSSCSGDIANVTYMWDKAYYYSAGGADGQWLDVGTRSDFADGSYYGQSVGSSTSKSGTVDKTQTLYWRINTHYSNGAWASSDSKQITTDCSQPTNPPVSGSCTLGTRATVPGAGLTIKGMNSLPHDTVTLQGIYDTEVFRPTLSPIVGNDTNWVSSIVIPTRKSNGSEISYGEYVVRVHGAECKVERYGGNVTIQGPGKMNLVSAKINCHTTNSGYEPYKLKMDMTVRLDTPRPGKTEFWGSIDGGSYIKGGIQFNEGLSGLPSLPLDFGTTDWQASVYDFSVVNVPSRISLRLETTYNGVTYVSNLIDQTASCPRRLNVCDFNFDRLVNVADSTALATAITYINSFYKGIPPSFLQHYDIAPKDGRVNPGDQGKLSNYIASPSTSVYCKDK